jgi:hypothetical protein
VGSGVTVVPPPLFIPPAVTLISIAAIIALARHSAIDAVSVPVATPIAVTVVLHVLISHSVGSSDWESTEEVPAKS